MSSIRLHREHGLNPTMPTCFWCGKEKGEIALLGAAYKDKAPMHMCIDQEPCDVCKANMTKGITLMEAREGVGGKPVFTGNWCVVTEDAVRRFITPKGMLDDVLKHRKAYIDSEAWAKLGIGEVGK